MSRKGLHFTLVHGQKSTHRAWSADLTMVLCWLEAVGEGA